MTEDEVLAALRIAHARHREAVTVAELAWVCAAEIEWDRLGDPGPAVIVDPTHRDLACLRHRLTALKRRGTVVGVQAPCPTSWARAVEQVVANLAGFSSDQSSLLELVRPFEWSGAPERRLVTLGCRIRPLDRLVSLKLLLHNIFQLLCVRVLQTLGSERSRVRLLPEDGSLRLANSVTVC